MSLNLYRVTVLAKAVDRWSPTSTPAATVLHQEIVVSSSTEGAIAVTKRLAIEEVKQKANAALAVLVVGRTVKFDVPEPEVVQASHVYSNVTVDPGVVTTEVRIG